MGGERYTDYDNFAWVYNQHWGGFSQLVVPIMDALFLRDLPEGSKVLDVACGTGHVSKLLAERGFKVTGLDGSAEMLRYARENAPEGEFLLEDARSFHLPPEFRAAVSTFDSLNHVLKLEELEAVFRNVHAALLPGGYFAFDMNMDAGYRAGWNGITGDSHLDHAYIWKNSYEPEEHLASFEATLFRLVDGSWQRSDVTLWQRGYSQEEIFGALELAGFGRLRAYQVSDRDELTLVPLDEEGRRGFFLCQKSNAAI